MTLVYGELLSWFVTPSIMHNFFSLIILRFLLLSLLVIGQAELLSAEDQVATITANEEIAAPSTEIEVSPNAVEQDSSSFSTTQNSTPEIPSDTLAPVSNNQDRPVDAIDSVAPSGNNLVEAEPNPQTIAGEDQPARNPDAVELNGDNVEFEQAGNKFVASGNVSIFKDGTRLTCDRVEFYKDSSIATAEGNVRLVTDQGTITGDKMTYNFSTMQGEFMGARISAAPFYGYAKIMTKDADKMVLHDGYLTTSDFDKPEYRFSSRKMEVYPGDKIIARSVKLVVGKAPLFYLPKMVQKMNGKPRFTITPGFSKEWGMFALTQYRFDLGADVKGRLHLDFREKLDVGEGLDLDYNTAKYGSGIFRTYYTNQRAITSKRFWQERPSPTPEQERYKVEWRHKWDVDAKTQAIWQYYKLSGPTFLKDFFEREYDRESNPASFFVLNRTLPRGNLSFRSDVRVNPYLSTIERLPEIRYDLTNQKLGSSNFYFKSINTYTNFRQYEASPTEVNRHTIRVDTENEVSYPMKVSFLELKPLVGGRQTYYSRTKDVKQYDTVRGIFTTGADVSTKFYKLYDVQRRFWGIAINRLRHIVTPSVGYRFSPDPTQPPTLFDQFDAIDGLNGDHTISFSLENKLQTKRKGQSVDLLRWVLSSPFRLKEYSGQGGFESVTSKIDFKPIDWLTFSSDANYNAHRDRLSSASFDLYVNDIDDKWYWSIGKRFNVDVDDQITTELGYKLNRKWKIKLYERFDTERGMYKEHLYTLTRDLHSWEMDLMFGEKRNEGAEILMVFRLKAFPESAIDIGSSFNKRKAGSQSTGN